MRFLPLLFALLMLAAVACNNEPTLSSNRNGGSDTTSIRGGGRGTSGTDSTSTGGDGGGGSDSTSTGGNTGGKTGGDSTSTGGGSGDTGGKATLSLQAQRTYGWMGQTIQVSANTTTDATISWHCRPAMVASVDENGLVTLRSITADTEFAVIGAANGISDTLTLQNRVWKLGVWNGSSWQTGSIVKGTAGGTIYVTLVDSNGAMINDDGFNAGVATFSVNAAAPEFTQPVTNIVTPTEGNGWQAAFTIATDAPLGSSFDIIAKYNGAVARISISL